MYTNRRIICRKHPLRILPFFIILILFLQSCLHEGMPIHAEEGTITTITKVVYHCHTGNSNGGGCYTVSHTGSREVRVDCPGSLVYYPAYDATQCDRCGAGYSGQMSGGCPHSHTETEYYTYYTPGCGRSPSTPVGSFTISYDKDTWATEITVTASHEASDMTVSDKPYSVNGSPMDSDSTVLSDNGSYTFNLNADSHANTAGAAITVDVRNIDKTSPQVGGWHRNTDEWTNEDVIIYLDNVTDLQPDNTEGCGLHESAYSYDEGETWTDEAFHAYPENGTFTILVRDKLENTTNIEVFIDNIDKEGPNITDISWDTTDNIKTTDIEVTADDILADGRDGCGLHDEAYSYDKGVTWTDDNTHTYGRNGAYEVWVRDKLENTSVKVINIVNLDDLGPDVYHTIWPGWWTNGDVFITFESRDKGVPHTGGIGLDDEPFSYDKGASWTKERELVVSENGDYFVIARDRHGNLTDYGVRVENIDREPPTVSLTMSEGPDSGSALLHADAYDAISGIASQGYSWNGEGYQGSADLSVTENGTYTVTVRDNAGNEASASIEVTSIRKPLFKKKITPTPTPEVKKIKVKKTKVNTEPRIAGAETEITKSIERKSMSMELIALLIVVATIVFAGLMFLLFLLFRSVRVYSEKGKDHFTLLGICLIKTKDENLILTVSQELWEKAETTHFRFRFTRVFCALHKQDSVYIHFPDEQVRKCTPERMVDIIL